MSNLPPPSSSQSMSPSVKSKKPWYKSTWFLILVGLIVVGNISNNFISDSDNSGTAPTTVLESATTTSTTTIPERLWSENLRVEVLATDLVLETCTELKKIIKEQTKLIESRITATEKPSKDQFDSADYIQEIEWESTDHLDTAIGLERAISAPVLTAGSMSLPTETQFSNFLDEAIRACGLLTDSDALENSARALDNRLIGMVSMAENLPWYPKGFEEFFPDIAFRVSKKGLDCYSCAGLVWEVVTNKSCPNSLYIEANHFDKSGVIDDWTNDTVRALEAGQIAEIELYFYSVNAGTQRIIKADCY